MVNKDIHRANGISIAGSQKEHGSAGVSGVELSKILGRGSVRSSHQTVSGTSKNWFYLPSSTQVFHT